MNQDIPPSDFTPPEIEEISALLPTYEILSFIAQGGMGAVYKARQKSLDRDVAIKVLPRHFGEDTEFRESFEAEAKSMAKFNHPNLIGIYDFGQVDGLLYIIMELVEGESLYHYSYGKTLDPAESTRIISDICMGLASAHNHGILHRDVKPANILLDSNGVPKIGDFGLARPVGEHEDTTIYGTPGYTAPEVVHQPTAVDQSTDLFSVGVMLYELLTTKLPESIYTKASDLVGCDPAYDKIIQRAVHPTPAMRFRSAEDFAKALNAIGTTSQPAASNLVTPSTPAAGATPRNISRRPSKPVKTGSNKPFVRNIFIIIGLLAAIYFAWDYLEKQKTERIAEQKKIDAEKEETARLNEKAREEAIEATNKKRIEARRNAPTAPLSQNSLIALLDKLRPQLIEGARTKLPASTIVEGNRARVFIEKKMSWYEAQEFCHRYGGHLPVIPTTADLNTLSSKLTNDQVVWLGAGSAGKNQWTWVDGTPWEHTVRKTSKSSYLATSNTGILQLHPESNQNSFFIEWLMDGKQPATLAEQLKRAGETLTEEDTQFPPGTVAYARHHYLLIKQNLDWATANQFAEDAQGRLAIVSSPEEHAWLLKIISSQLGENQACWIGGLRPAGKDWQWSTGKPLGLVKWQEGAPDVDAQTAAVSAIGGNQLWNDYTETDKLPYFIIEWNKNETAEKAAATLKDPDIGSRRKKCATLIRKIQKDYDTKMTRNIKSYESGVSSYSRNLNKSQNEIQKNTIAAMTAEYPDGRIPQDVSRVNMHPKLAKVLDEHLDEQKDIIAAYTAQLEELRGKYHSSLKNQIGKLSGAEAVIRKPLYQGEIEATNDHKSFVQYVLGEKK